MADRLNSRTALMVIAALNAGGFGCASGGGGCGGGLTALPAQPGPWGFPMDQAIEGGMQARITKPGFTKISALIPEIAKSALPTMAKPACLPKQDLKLQVAGTGADVQLCYDACGAGIGCAMWTDLRPDLAPPGGISISMQDNTTKAVVDIDAAFDVHMVIPAEWKFCVFGLCGGWNHVCDLHVDGPGTHIKGAINLDIDPPTGKLVPSVGDLTLPGLNLQTSNCGLASDLFNGVLGVVNAVARSFLGNLVIGLIKPQLTTLVQGLLPNPPGLVGVVDTAKLFASFSPPAGAGLETLIVLGGYVSAKNGGLNLGVISGMNSDRDKTTRDPGKASEPSLCVPIRPVIDIGAAPYGLPVQALRKDHYLSPAGPFSGTPDPMDMMGGTKDLAIGLSRTFLDLAGFHMYNSGTLCLSISGGVLSAFNAGALSILINSLGNILDNRKAPVAIALRPQTPLRFTLGEGTAKDPLLHVHVDDMRIDFYAFIEERYVRIFTLALDLNVGIALSVTMGADKKPAIAIAISGIDKANVTARVSNTDLLTEDPKKIAAGLLSLIDIAVGQIAGGVKPFALPSIMGFSIDGLEITRVQTAQDDFLAIFGTLAQNAMTMLYPLPEDLVSYEREPSSIETRAQIVDVSVPPPDVIHEAVMAGAVGGETGNVPTVTLKLGASISPAEWCYRIDGSAWHPWSTDARPTIADAAFHLQAKHVIDVRARAVGDWASEDQTPERLEVTIDSMPPELKLKVESGAIVFDGWDNVSDTSEIRYSWQTPDGETKTARADRISFDEAWAASGKGSAPLRVKAVDELGNHKVASLDLTSLNEFHGRMTVPAAGGCGCVIGGRAGDAKGERLALFCLLPLLGLLLRRRQR